ncbi:hypothetical protein PC119_g26495 [Phytophthora cactorum]|nr:hypothetical protein PC119_g26495 [Phytophthora cactorum]
MDAALISTEQLRVAFALSNLSGRAKSWAYTREATTPGCFASWAQLCEQLRAAFLPANYEYRQRSRFLSWKQGKRELHEYIQEMWELTASLVGNSLHEHIKVTVFMDGLRVGPARTQLFRVQASTLEEAIQVDLQEEYSHRQARTPASAWPGGSTPNSNRTSPSQPVPMELGLAEQQGIRCYGCGGLGHMKRACPAGGQRKRFPPRPLGLKGRWQKPRPRGQGNASDQDFAPESLCTLKSEKGSGGLLVLHARVRGYELPFRVLIDSGASKNFARRQTVASNSNKLTDALTESKGKGTVSVQLADGKVITVPRIHMDLAVKFEDFDSSEQFTVLEMDKYDLILGIPWLEKHEPWIDWRGKAIGASRPAVSDRALSRQDAVASKEYLGVVDVFDDSTEVVAPAAAPDRARQPCSGSPRSPPESRPVDEASKVAAPGSTCQEGVERAFCVSNSVPHGAVSAPDVAIASSHDVGNEVPRRGRRRRHRRRRKSNLNNIQTGVAPSDSESRARAPLTRPVEECYHIFDGMIGRPVKAAGIHLEPLPEVSELLNLEEMAVDDCLADLKAGEIAETSWKR